MFRKRRRYSDDLYSHFDKIPDADCKDGGWFDIDPCLSLSPRLRARTTLRGGAALPRGIVIGMVSTRVWNTRRGRDGKGFGGSTTSARSG